MASNVGGARRSAVILDAAAGTIHRDEECVPVGLQQAHRYAGGVEIIRVRRQEKQARIRWNLDVAQRDLS